MTVSQNLTRQPLEQPRGRGVFLSCQQFTTLEHSGGRGRHEAGGPMGSRAFFSAGRRRLLLLRQIWASIFTAAFVLKKRSNFFQRHFTSSSHESRDTPGRSVGRLRRPRSARQIGRLVRPPPASYLCTLRWRPPRPTPPPTPFHARNFRPPWLRRASERRSVVRSEAKMVRMLTCSEEGAGVGDI